MGVYEIIENEVSGVCVWREVLWIDHGKRKVHKLLQLWREVLWIDHGKRKKRNVQSHSSRPCAFIIPPST
jgi:hypothetical protein